MRKPLIGTVTIALPLAIALVLCGCADVSERPAPGASELTPDGQRFGGTEEAWLAFHDLYPDVPRPSVEVVRSVTLNEWPAAQASCMTDAGFPKKVEDGGVSGFVPEGQAEAHDLASFKCSASFPLDSQYSDKLPEERLKELYAYFTLDLIPCLGSNGFEVSEVPSEDVFVDSYYQSTSWSPFDELIESPAASDRFSELAAACPPLPASFTG